ncbi:MAG: hypothetical protein IPJ69_02715 [Deltaproteobacteria bacterium]|nr:MAG: hypothetical protein IPJ69_02715 [Deltaproteobacteria bacterium]
MPGIGVVLNPHSKRYKNDPEKLHRMGFIVGEKASLASTQNLTDIRRVAEEFKRKEIEILALSGGDGTNHLTLTHFFEVYGDQPLPKIALLRGGTLNTVAYSCGIFGSPEKNLSNLIYKYHEDEPFETTEVDLMQINDKCGFIWGCGVISKFMEAYYKNGIPSPPQAAWILMKSVGSALINGPFASHMFEPMEAEVTVDGKKWEMNTYSAIFSGSIPYLGLGFKVFYLARKVKKFHAIGFCVKPRTVLPHVPLMFLGKPSGCPNHLEQATNEMVVKLAKPSGYTIDGDLYPPTDTFVIKTGPRLTIIVK